jgi:hypothetical protein
MMGFPAMPSAFQRWSSVNMNMMFGLSAWAKATIRIAVKQNIRREYFM